MIEIVITMKPDFTLRAYLTIKIMRKSAMKDKKPGSLRTRAKISLRCKNSRLFLIMR